QLVGGQQADDPRADHGDVRHERIPPDGGMIRIQCWWSAPRALSAQVLGSHGTIRVYRAKLVAWMLRLSRTSPPGDGPVSPRPACTCAWTCREGERTCWTSPSPPS